MRSTAFEGLPGQELVTAGLENLRSGVTSSEEALLLLIAAPRLRRLGLEVPTTKKSDKELPFEHQLYSLLEKKRGRDAHSYYHALLGRIASFASCLEREISREP